MTELAVPAVLLVLAVASAYLLMWRGWRRREHKHDLPPLVPVDGLDGRSEGSDATSPFGPPVAARYFGTTVAGDWLDRVVAHSLGTRSRARLVLSPVGLDVHRPGSSFRIPAGAIEGARHDQGIAGKVVPPHGLLVVTWQHGGRRLDSGFRLADSATHDHWTIAISRLCKEPA